MPLILSAFLFLLGCAPGTSLAQKPVPVYQVEEVASGLDHPWALAFLPTGELLLTERSGNLRLIRQGQVSAPVEGLPEDIYVKGQGGLQDLILHPDYIKNGWLYLSYSSGKRDANALKVVRARLDKHRLQDLELILRVWPDKDTPVHYGARMAFLPDNSLLIASGDGFDFREDAQRLHKQLGKILRIKDDGSLPRDNPYIDSQGEQAKVVFSLGHRNPQGIVYDPYNQVVFAHEHGPAGGDELNIIHPGNNYGWPVVTNGRDYSGASISPFKDYPGMELPLLDWTPSIAPSGMALYTGHMFASMRGDLLVSTLKSQEVRWLQMKGSKVTAQVSLFKQLKSRIRDVRVHPDGSIYLLTDSDNGRVLRVSAN